MRTDDATRTIAMTIFASKAASEGSRAMEILSFLRYTVIG